MKNLTIQVIPIDSDIKLAQKLQVGVSNENFRLVKHGTNAKGDLPWFYREKSRGAEQGFCYAKGDLPN